MAAPVAEYVPLVKQGWLKKKGHFIKNWKQRWFVLSDLTLFYFTERNNKADDSKGEIDLFGCSLVKKSKLRFEITTKAGKAFEIEAKDEEEMLDWVAAIAHNVRGATLHRTLTQNLRAVETRRENLLAVEIANDTMAAEVPVETDEDVRARSVSVVVDEEERTDSDNELEFSFTESSSEEEIAWEESGAGTASPVDIRASILMKSAERSERAKERQAERDALKEQIRLKRIEEQRQAEAERRARQQEELQDEQARFLEEFADREDEELKTRVYVDPALAVDCTSRQQEFNTTFGMGDSERLYNFFTCMMLVTVPRLGTMYISENYVAFDYRLNGLGDTALIPMKEIKEVLLLKNYRVLVHVLQLRTEKAKYIFSSWLPGKRSKAYDIISQLIERKHRGATLAAEAKKRAQSARSRAVSGAASSDGGPEGSGTGASGGAEGEPAGGGGEASATDRTAAANRASLLGLPEPSHLSESRPRSSSGAASTSEPAYMDHTVVKETSVKIDEYDEAGHVKTGEFLRARPRGNSIYMSEEVSIMPGRTLQRASFLPDMPLIRTAPLNKAAVSTHLTLIIPPGYNITKVYGAMLTRDTKGSYALRYQDEIEACRPRLHHLEHMDSLVEVKYMQKDENQSIFKFSKPKRILYGDSYCTVCGQVFFLEEPEELKGADESTPLLLPKASSTHDNDDEDEEDEAGCSCAIL